MIPHAIRLRQPWEELAPGLSKAKVFRRRFNRPTGLDAWERVTLEIDRVLCCGTMVLNGVRVGSIEPGVLFSADITPQLQSTNELTAEVDPDTELNRPPPSSSIYIVDDNEPLGSPIGEVRLVIRSVSAPANE